MFISLIKMSNKEVYLYLDINGKLDQNFFQKPDVFFKIVNLHKEHPLIQIGNYVFQGTYEDYLGTKVFLVESENNEPDENVFVRQTPLHLEYLCKTTKILQLKWMKLPHDVVHLDESELLDIQFKETYNEVLKKLEKGQLFIEDVVKEEAEKAKNSVDLHSQVKTTNQMEVDQASCNDNVFEEQNKADHLSAGTNDFASNPSDQISVDKYSVLKGLASKPMKQKDEFLKVYKIEPSQLKTVTDVEDFAVFKQLFVQSLSSDYFPAEKINTEEFTRYVNIEKSVKDGIISEADAKCLTEKHKQALLSAANFSNFSVPVKLAYLIEQLKEHKRLIESMAPQDMDILDKHGRNAKDRYKLLKRLTKDVWLYIYSHYADS